MNGLRLCWAHRRPIWLALALALTGCKSAPWANDEERATAYAKEDEGYSFWREATGGRWNGDPDTDGFDDD
jgi:hypothetical protein